MNEKLYGLWCTKTSRWQCLLPTLVYGHFVSSKAICLALYHNKRAEYAAHVKRGYRFSYPSMDKSDSALALEREEMRQDWKDEGLAVYELGEDGLPVGEPLTDGELGV